MNCCALYGLLIEYCKPIWRPHWSEDYVDKLILIDQCVTAQQVFDTVVNNEKRTQINSEDVGMA